ncbi:hypothetical protein GCM10027068_10010 [Prescottella soli]
MDCGRFRAAGDVDQAGVPPINPRPLPCLAQAAADGLHLGPDADPVEFHARLLGLPGIGPWTAEYLAVRVLSDRDAYPSGDLVLRRALGGEDRARGRRGIGAVAAVAGVRPVPPVASQAFL